MKWSWSLGRIAGIEIRMHATFLLLLAWIAILQYQYGGPRSAVLGVFFILALFASVVLHELGHALTARRFGVGTREITLLPIGGIAQLERMPREPRHELLIALAGPAVTIVIAVVTWLIMLAAGLHPVLLASFRNATVDAPFLERFLDANIILAAFNLIPAFPMDGGRVLRAALAMRMPYTRATEIAASIGKAFALVLGIAGLFGPSPNFWWVFIALFIWLGAAAEASQAQTTSAFDGVPVSSVMIRDVRTLAPADPLSDAVEHVLAGFQQDFPVVEHGRVVGLLTRSALMRALATAGPSAPVSQAMQREVHTATADEPLETAFATLQACRCQTLPVLHGDALVGVLTAENVAEFVMIRGALRGRG